MLSRGLRGIPALGSKPVAFLFAGKFRRPVLAGATLLALVTPFLLPNIGNDPEECVVLQDNKEGKSPAKVGPAGWVQALAFSPDGTLLASGWGKPGAPGVCQLWDVAGRQLHAVFQTANAIYGAAFAADGRTLALGSWDGSVTLWELATGRQIHLLRLPVNRVKAVAFSPDGTVVVAGTDHAVVCWDVPTGQERVTLSASSPLAFSPDGRTLATARDEAAGMRLWDWRTGQAQGDLQATPTDPDSTREVCSWALAFSADGQTLVSADTDFRVRLWDVEQQRLRAVFPRYADQLVALAFSPDRRVLATGSIEGTIVLWDVATSRPLATLRGHTGVIHSLAFAPDGRTLASGSFDETLRLWNVAKALTSAPP